MENASLGVRDECCGIEKFYQGESWIVFRRYSEEPARSPGGDARRSIDHELGFG